MGATKKKTKTKTKRATPKATPRSTAKAAATRTKKGAAAEAVLAVPPNGAALCSSRVVGPKRKDILFAYRQEPDNDADSGWRFLHGDESETFLGDPKNCLVCPLDLVFAMDGTLEPLAKKRVGSAYKRESVDARWEKIADYDPDA